MEYSLILVAHHICIREWNYIYPLQYGNPTLMQSSIFYKARNTVKQSWMIFYCLLHQKNSHITKLEDLLKA